ncbi:DegV family protein [Fructilactobacillus sp. Tb1]|uniref:DegV family protein n=1 Tax=Fructilactobacillus sp. Tb1 TaxID=3422304 RepID=UPI003D29F420
MIHIVTDSTAQVTPEEIKKYNITIVPLQVTFEGKTYEDNVNLTRQEFSKMLDDNEAEFPKTSQPALGQFVTTFESIMKEDPEGTIICLDLAPVLSGTVETAASAAQQIDGDIRVIDSETTDRGLGLEVIRAAELAQAGKIPEEVIAGVDAYRNKIRTFVMIKSFDYLVKGGRASRAVGFISSLIKLMVALEVKDGKLEFYAKCRGNKKLRKVRDKLVDEIIANPEVSEVGLSYVDSTEDVDEIKARINQERPDINVLARLTSPIIMTHVGPGGYSIIFN